MCVRERNVGQLLSPWNEVNDRKLDFFTGLQVIKFEIVVECQVLAGGATLDSGNPNKLSYGIPC